MANNDKKSKFDLSKKPEENPDHLIEDYGPENVEPKEDPIMETEEVMGVPEPPKPKKSNFWLWAIVAMAIILAFILLVIVPRSDKSAEPVKTHSEIAVIDQGATDSGTMDSANGLMSAGEAVSSADAGSGTDNTSSVSGNVSGTSKDGVNSGDAGADASAAKATSATGDIEELARKVIRGQFGDGSIRKQQLGDKYAAVQARVNQILRGK